MKSLKETLLLNFPSTALMLTESFSIQFNSTHFDLSSVTLKLQKGNLARIKKFEKFSFLLGGIILLISIYDRYDSGGIIPGPYGILNTAAYLAGGLVNIIAGVFYDKIPAAKRESVGRWLQIIIAILFLFDAIDKFIRGKIAMPVTLIFASLLYFMIALFSDKLKGRRFLSIDDDKVSFRKSLFKIRTVRIEDIKDISYSPQKIILNLTNKKSIALFPAENDDKTIKLFVDKINAKEI